MRVVLGYRGEFLSAVGAILVCVGALPAYGDAGSNSSLPVAEVAPSPFVTRLSGTMSISENANRLADGHYQLNSASFAPPATVDIRSGVGANMALEAKDRVTSGVSSAASKSYTCIYTSKNKNFKAYVPASMGLDTHRYFLQYLYYPYSVSNARTVVGLGHTYQIEVCTNGGGRVKDWHRMATNVSSISAPNSRVVRIGWTWGTGASGGHVDSSLGFKVSAGPVEISASLPVRKTGHYDGSLGSDVDNGRIGNPFNQINARWDFDYPGLGTSAFEGNNGHWLAEYAQNDRQSHPISIDASIRPRY